MLEERVQIASEDEEEAIGPVDGGEQLAMRSASVVDSRDSSSPMLPPDNDCQHQPAWEWVHETSCRWLLSALKGDLDPASYVAIIGHPCSLRRWW